MTQGSANVQLLLNVQGKTRQILKKIVAAYCSYPAPWRVPYQYIFILSHMRSGSSLLTHLLASNPEISGYGETHTTYSSREDLAILAAKIAYFNGRFPRLCPERYLLDKVLHTRLLDEQHASLLRRDDMHVIFLLREPEAAIPSMIKNLVRLNYDEQRALDYYTRRLATLEAQAQELASSQRLVLLTYDQLVQQTSDVFRLLEDFLDLRYPLVEHYEMLPTTGRRGIGDVSANIRAGRILRTKARAPQNLLSPQLRRAAAAYERCYETLSKCCVTLEAV